MKKIFGILLVICFVALIGYLLMKKPGSAYKPEIGSQKVNYYQDLKKQCGGDSCCLASVDNMEQVSAIIEPEGGCDTGYRRDMLKCVSSYRWCEQIKNSTTSSAIN